MATEENGLSMVTAVRQMMAENQAAGKTIPGKDSDEVRQAFGDSLNETF